MTARDEQVRSVPYVAEIRAVDMPANQEVSKKMQSRASRSDRARRIGLGVVFLWFLLGGIAHFVATETEMRVVPPYIPWPRAAVLLSGMFELAGAAGLLLVRQRRRAGMGLVLLTVAVTPVHIYMLQRSDLFGIPYWALVLRLPLQLALIALIVWCTADAATCPKGEPASPGGGPAAKN